MEEGIEVPGTAAPAAGEDIAPAGIEVAVEDTGVPEDIVPAMAGIDPAAGIAADIVAGSARMRRAEDIAAAHPELTGEL